MIINKVGYHYSHPANFVIKRPNGSGDYLLLIVRSSAEFFLDNQKRSVLPGSVILYRKGTPQHYKCKTPPFVNDWIHFDLEDAETDFLRQCGIPFDRILHFQDVSSLSEIVKSMYRENFSRSVYREETLSLYLKILFFKIAEKMKNDTLETGSRYYQQLSKVRAEIYHHPAEKYTVRQLAEQLPVSESYFQHLYKKYFGVSVFADVVNSRIDFASFLLSSTENTVKEIAAELHYPTSDCFMRQFKSVTGLTPTAYRKSHAAAIDNISDGKAKRYSKNRRFDFS